MSDRRRIQLKTLVVSCSVPPALNGSSSVIGNLTLPFSSDELVLAGERTPGELSQEWTVAKQSKPALVYIHHQWKWRFKRTVRLMLAPLILIRLLWLYRRTGCKQVVGVFPDEFFLSLSLIVAFLNNAPYYSYFHNTYLDNRRGVRLLFAKWLQYAVFHRSKTIFVMSDAMGEQWKSRYPNFDFTTLVHACNELPCKPVLRDHLSSDFRIAFMGSINDSNREAMSRLPEVLARFPQAQLTIHSMLPERYFAAIGLCGNQISVERAPEPVSRALSQFDLLFLPHGFSGALTAIEYQTIFPTRTVPYLLSGVPTIAHSPADAYLTQWLRQNDCAEVVDVASVDALHQSFLGLLNDFNRRRQIVQNSLVAVEQFSVIAVANQFQAVLNRFASNEVLPSDNESN